jgi:DNA phosphorothioation-dependent restriction protein DptG
MDYVEDLDFDWRKSNNFKSIEDIKKNHTPSSKEVCDSLKKELKAWYNTNKNLLAEQYKDHKDLEDAKAKLQSKMHDILGKITEYYNTEKA